MNLLRNCLLLAAIVGTGLVLSPTASAAMLTFNSSGTDARVVTENGGARDDNNGGNTATGALIGLNTGGVDNFLLYRFNDLGTAAGETVVSATVTLNVATGFTNGNHGDAADKINLSEIALPNTGWVSGGGVITGADTPADDGSVSFANRVQYDGSGVTEPWKDAGDNNVGNLLSALSLLGTVDGYASGGGTPVLTFNIDPATAQSWIDNGLAGVVLGVTDAGDSKSRFNFVLDAANLEIVTQEVPEPSSILLVGLGVVGLAMVRRR